MKVEVIFDIETNSLEKPTKIWCIVTKDINTKEQRIYRNLTEDDRARQDFLQYARTWTRAIGHNILGYDCPHLEHLIGWAYDYKLCVDTLIVSKLVEYSRQGHSLEQFGEEFGIPKGKNHYLDFFKSWSQELEDYCVRDVEISERVYRHYLRVVDNPEWSSSLRLEHEFQLICNELHGNGFGFDTGKASVLLTQIQEELEGLDKEILSVFPPREILIREFTPRATKYGTISKTSIPRSCWDDIHKYEVGETYRHTKFEPFNPASHKQIVQVLREAGWSPEDKTQTHIDTERELNRLKRDGRGNSAIDLSPVSDKLLILRTTGWKVNETNLSTLPPSAPAPARTLARRILLESRRRTLVEWLGLVRADNRIHGKFHGIGAWTHRMAHQAPNTANIPKEFNIGGTRKLLGREMRELWIAPPNRLLVGVDAEGIQLRIFAHYINDLEFTAALVKGKKDDKSDPHSLNQRILGRVCKTRDAAKRFIYALLLGAGIDKLAAILEANRNDTQESLDRLLQRYTGFADLKRTAIPKDAKRGYFVGLDGRRVPIPGETQRDREHLCMSGYLQNGEAIVVKRAACWINRNLADEKKRKEWLFVDIVHDELQSETTLDQKIALRVAKLKADAIRVAGEELNLRCPLAGSYYNDDIKQYTIGKDWYQTH